MLKKKISFKISHLKSLHESENGCVTIVKNFKGTLVLLPFHLGYLKHAVKELLDNKVSKYDPELNGIVLGHSNIKVINFIQHSDSYKINLKYLADIYLFTPEVGKNLTGIINKKSKEHIGCLVHTAFNASIPKPRIAGEDLSIWFRTNGTAQIGNELEFTVSKVDFSSKVPHITGTIVKTGYDYKEEEVDSGVCCHNSFDETESKPKKKKRKSKDNDSFLETDYEYGSTSYQDPDKILELINSNAQSVKGKKKKSLGKKTGEEYNYENEPSSSSNLRDRSFKIKVEDELSFTFNKEIKKERLSLSPNRITSAPKSKKSKKRNLELSDSYDLNKVKSEEPTVDELSSLLLKEAMENCFSPKHSDASTSSDYSKKKKKKKKHSKSLSETPIEVDLSICKTEHESSPLEETFFQRYDEPSQSKFHTSEIEKRKTKKRKRSESPSKLENEDVLYKKSKKKKLKNSMDSLEMLTSSLLAESMSKLK